MATSLDTSEFDWSLKDLYDTGRVALQVYTENVAFARMSKNTKFKGDKYIYATKYRDITGRSRTFARALANRGPAKGVDWQISRLPDYAIGRIGTEVMLASDEDPAAFMDAVESESDSAINAIRRSLGIATYGNGSGQIGSVSSPGADPTVTLENSDDITNFEEGLVIVAAADDTSALRSGAESGRGYVGDVDRDAGTFEMENSSGTPTNATTQITSFTDGDAIFVDGDYVSASDRLKVAGFTAWNPKRTTAVTASFNGVVRSVDRSRLAGVAYDGTSHPGLNTSEAMQLVASRLKRQGKRADTCYMGTDRYRNLINSLDSKAEFIKDTVRPKDRDGRVVAEIGFDGVRVRCGGVVLDVYEDLNCPEKAIFVQKHKVFEMRSLKECPMWLASKRVVEDADEIEWRLAYYGNILCRDTSAIGRYDFP